MSDSSVSSGFWIHITVICENYATNNATQSTQDFIFSIENGREVNDFEISITLV